MSVKVMGAVWDADLPRPEKFILLAYADHAAHDGSRIYPSIGRIAWKTGYAERSVQRITRRLEKEGILIHTGWSDQKTKSYRLALENLPQRPNYTGKGGGDKMSPQDEGGGDILSGGGDILSGGGDKNDVKGCQNVTQTVMNRHEPSCNRHDANSTKIWSEMTRKEKSQRVFGRLVDLCQMDLDTITKKNRGKLNRVTKKLLDLNTLPDGLELLQCLDLFERYWVSEDWRGKKGQPPNPYQVLNEWGRFKAWLQEGGRDGRDKTRTGAAQGQERSMSEDEIAEIQRQIKQRREERDWQPGGKFA